MAFGFRERAVRAVFDAEDCAAAKAYGARTAAVADGYDGLRFEDLTFAMRHRCRHDEANRRRTLGHLWRAGTDDEDVLQPCQACQLASFARPTSPPPLRLALDNLAVRLFRAPRWACTNRVRAPPRVFRVHSFASTLASRTCGRSLFLLRLLLALCRRATRSDSTPQQLVSATTTLPLNPTTLPSIARLRTFTVLNRRHGFRRTRRRCHPATGGQREREADGPVLPAPRCEARRSQPDALLLRRRG